MTPRLVPLYRFTLCVLALLSLEATGLDHGGSDFYVTFLPYRESSYGEGTLLITTPESVPVNFTISAPGTGYFHRATVDPGEVKVFNFSGEGYELRSTTDRSKGIIITAENEKQIFVYGAQDITASTDSFLALPPHDLGAASYTYFAAMMHTLFDSNNNAHIGIVSAENDTLLTITPTQNVTIGTKSVQAGESVLVTLHRAETLRIAFDGDLTGTKVVSNRPISFFSGDQCSWIPSGVGFCDQIVEQLPPVEAWGRQFATAPLKTRMSYDLFRFVASENSTTVNISCTLSNGNQGYADEFVLNEGGFADVQVSSDSFCWLEAEKRVLLLQFAVGREADFVLASDPFLAFVPAVSHYTNSLTLPVVNSSSNNFTHYLNIIIPAEHYQPDQIFMDGQSLQSLALDFVAIVRNGETMAYAAQIEVDATTHTLIHYNGGLLGVLSYGFGRSVSYGHVGGIQLKPLAPPTMLTILEINSTSITISWRPPQQQLEEGSTISYLITVTDTMGNSVVIEVKNTTLHIRVPDLLPGHAYRVAVAAVTEEGVSPSISQVVTTNPVTKPLTPPTMLTILEITSTSLTVSWRPPQGQLEEGSTISYLINVTDTKGNSVINEVNDMILLIRVPELLPDHVYQVVVAAVSGERVGPSIELFVKTSPVVVGVTVAPQSSNMTAVITLGSLLGLWFLVAIVAVITLGVVICLCVYFTKRKSKGTGTINRDTTYIVGNNNAHLQQKPTYRIVYQTGPNANVYQE